MESDTVNYFGFLNTIEVVKELKESKFTHFKKSLVTLVVKTVLPVKVDI